MRTILLAFLLSFGLGHSAFGADDNDLVTSDSVDSKTPMMYNEELAAPFTEDAANRPQPPGHQNPTTHPGPRNPGPVGHPGPRGPMGPYHGHVYDHGHWYYPDGRLYPIYPIGWIWDPIWYPRWWVPSITFPAWYWIAEIPYGYWQCTAFNEYLEPFAAIGATRNQAAYNATYACGGQSMGCYIPHNYCQYH